MSSLREHFAKAMAALAVDGPLAVAVSGGPDSMALLALTADWAKAQGIEITALTVNHLLRDEAAAEAAMVEEWCARKGILHHTLLWDRQAEDCGNLQAAARQARYRLMGDWCAAHKVGAVLVAHHADDQAETLLMRLGRGSGVDGLAAMAKNAPWPVLQENAPQLLRPLLGVRREALMAFAQAEGLPHVQDPSNQDTRFDRVTTREAIGALELDVDRLTRTADLMAEEKAALDWAVRQAMDQVAEISAHGFVTLDRVAFEELPPALAGRLLRHILQGMGNAAYPPRKEAVMRLREAVIEGGGHSLAGVSLSAEGHLFPEHLPEAVELPVGIAAPWGRCFVFEAGEAGWHVIARGNLAASAFSGSQIAQISTLPAAVRPTLPIVMGADGKPHLPTFGENAGKVSISDDLRGALTIG